MAIDTSFHKIKEPLSSAALARIAELVPFNDIEMTITHAAQPSEADEGSICYITDKSLISGNEGLSASAIITTKELASDCPSDAAIFVAKNPRIAFSLVLSHLYKTDKTHMISDKADISDSAKIGKNVSIGAFAVIGDDVEIGDNVQIAPHAVIEASCQISDGCVIGAHCHISFSKLGKNVSIAANTVIGKQGFGFEMTANGAILVPHLGLVEIADNVKIGANCAIDRGVLGNTTISSNVMIDNQVHIAHNVTVGRNSILLAQVAIAGSSQIGHNVILGGQVGVKDHVTIADGVIIFSSSIVTKSINQSGTYAGNPAVPSRDHWRELAALKKLVKKKT